MVIGGFLFLMLYLWLSRRSSQEEKKLDEATEPVEAIKSGAKAMISTVLAATALVLAALILGVSVLPNG